MKCLIALLFAISITFSQSSLAASFQDELKEAKQGNPVAQFRLGLLYKDGEGVRQDYAEAKEWFGKSCDNGFQMGCEQYRELNNL